MCDLPMLNKIMLLSTIAFWYYFEVQDNRLDLTLYDLIDQEVVHRKHYAEINVYYDTLFEI